MRNTRTLLMVIAVASIAISAAAADNTKVLKLAGIDVILRQTTANEVVSAIMFIKGGTSALPSGTTSAIEGMSLKIAAESGTTTDSKEEYQRDLSAMVSTIEGKGGRDYSQFSMRCVREHFPGTWKLFSSVIFSPAFDSVEIMKEKRSQITAIKSLRSNPDAYVQYLGDSVYFQSHPYAQRPTVDEVNALTVEHLRAHFKSLFVKSRLLLVVVGNVNEADLKQMVEQTLGGLPGGTYNPPMLPMVSRQTPTAVIADKKLPTTYILGGYAAPNRRNPDYWAMVMATTTLNDRLFTEVRVKRNLSYAPNAGLRPDEIAVGVVYVSTTNPDSAMRVIFRCIDSLQNVPMSDKEVKSQVAQFLTTILLRDETNAGQAEALGRYQLMTGNWENSQRVVEKFQKLTPSDIQNVAKKYMHTFTFAAVGKADGISKALLESR